MLPRFQGFVRTFVLFCVGVFLLQLFALHGPLGQDVYHSLNRFLGLVPELFFKGMIFQPLTWVFLHGSLLHLVFNMFAFWMFGSLLEETWGTKKFIQFTILSGALTGVFVATTGLFDSFAYSTPTIGASGIVFAILMAISRLFPNQIVLFFFVFPMRMRYFAYLMIAFEFYALYTSNQQGVSNLAHLGGAAIGYFATTWFGSGRGTKNSGGNWFRNMLDRWHQRRMRKRLRLVRQDVSKMYH